MRHVVGVCGIFAAGPGSCRTHLIIDPPLPTSFLCLSHTMESGQVCVAFAIAAEHRTPITLATTLALPGRAAIGVERLLSANRAARRGR